MSSTALTTTSSGVIQPDEWASMVAQAEAFARTDIVPKPFRGEPHAIIAVSAIGRELGLSPMMSMQYVNVIDGKPSVTPELMNARIRAAGHSITVVEWTNEVCTLRGKRRDNGEELLATFTMDDARRAELDGKTNWTHHPRAMLWARALAQLARALFPDAILGARYTPEELGAEVDADGQAIGTTATEPLPAHLAEHVAAPVAAPAETDVDATDVEVLGEEPGHAPAAVAPVMPVAAPVVAPAASTFVQPGGGETATGDGGFAQPTPPPPPTPEKLHRKECDELFRKGWPMGNCKGGDPMDPDAVDDGSLRWLADKAEPDHPQYGKRNKRQLDWILAELRRRENERTPSDFQPQAMGRAVNNVAEHGELDAGAAAAMERDPDPAPTPAPAAKPKLTQQQLEQEATPEQLDWLCGQMVKFGYAPDKSNATTQLQAVIASNGAMTVQRLQENSDYMKANPHTVPA